MKRARGSTALALRRARGRKLALDRFGLAPHEAVFIDDNRDNVVGAEAVGMAAIHFTDAPALRRELAGLGLPVTG